MTSRHARDSFLHFLADNLTGRTVHALRVDSNAPDAGELAMNSVNVHFLSSQPGVDLSTLNVSIDVIYDDENTGVDVAEEVWAILSAAFFTPLLDYTNPAAPVHLGSNLFWSKRGVAFQFVHRDYYSHQTSSLQLRY